MAEEGKNKVADSLLDLQPTAILELFRIFPDKVNKPTLFLGFHGGTVFNKSINWQGVQYLPLSMETEGFDIFGDGKLARPKLRVLNNDYIITNFLQNLARNSKFFILYATGYFFLYISLAGNFFFHFVCPGELLSNVPTHKTTI